MEVVGLFETVTIVVGRSIAPRRGFGIGICSAGRSAIPSVSTSAATQASSASATPAGLRRHPRRTACGAPPSGPRACGRDRVVADAAFVPVCAVRSRAAIIGTADSGRALERLLQATAQQWGEQQPAHDAAPAVSGPCERVHADLQRAFRALLQLRAAFDWLFQRQFRFVLRFQCQPMNIRRLPVSVISMFPNVNLTRLSLFPIVEFDPSRSVTQFRVIRE
jgi:hypothetical protein